MMKTVSPAAAGKRVLRAFPKAEVDGEMPQRYIEQYFRQQAYPTHQLLMGLRYATQTGWIRATGEQSFALTSQGLDALGEASDIGPANPLSPWHAWAHL